MVLNGRSDGARVGFVSYYKGDYSVHILDRKEPLGAPVTTEDFGSPGPIVDFQAPLTHTLVDSQSEAEGQVREAVTSKAGRR